MWITPLDALTSVVVTAVTPPFSSVKITDPFLRVAFKISPLTVLIENSPPDAFMALITSLALN